MEEFWKEFWPVAVFIVICIISVMRNASKLSQSGGVADNQPGEQSQSYSEAETCDNFKSNLSDKAKPRHSEGNRAVAASTADDPHTVSVAERGAKVPLKGKSDVKKAFIYSEIFKRKYT